MIISSTIDCIVEIQLGRIKTFRENTLKVKISIKFDDILMNVFKKKLKSGINYA